MNPQELQNQIQDLENKLSSLETKFSQLTESFTMLSNTKPISHYIDEDSKKIIEEIVRRFATKTETTVGATFTLNVSTQYHKITASGASRTSSTTNAISDGFFIGQILILEGTDDTNTVIIKDNANTKLSGDITLGLNDTLTLLWNGSDWIMLATTDN